MLQEDKIHVFKDIYYYVPVSTAKRPIETLFQNLPKAEQYWRRQTDFVINKNFPNIFFDYNPHLPVKKRVRLNATTTYYSGDKLISLSTEDTQALIKLVEREVYRMTYGIFVMNNGIRIYFPGAYYGLMQWCKFLGNKSNDGYAEHRRYQRDYACQRQKCIDDDLLNGYYLQKIKKCGITAELACLYAIESITSRQFIAAMMSKTHDTAKSANFKYYTYALKNMPFVLLPSIENSRWASAVQKIEIRVNDKELSLENTVVAVPTTEDGIDGLPPLKRVNLDEIPKMTEAEAILTKTKEQLKLQSEKQGIIEMTSYPPEDDTKSFKYCKNLHTKDCFDLDENGYPKNGIIPLYIGLAEATKGTHDIYGEPDKVKAVAIEKAVRDKLDTPAKLQARKRQYHLDIKESWESGGGGSVYNNLILAEQEARLEESLTAGVRGYVEGNLEWTAGRFSAVRFVPLTHKEIMDGKTAKWRFYIGDGNIELLNEWFKKNTNLCISTPRRIKYINRERHMLLQPTEFVTAVGAIDPVDYRLMSEMGQTKSTNASVTKDIEGNLICVYYDRDENPDVNLEDFCLEIVFLGKYTLVEANKGVAFTTLEKEGLCYFLLVKHSNGEIKPYAEKVTIKPISSSADLIRKYITLTTKMIVNHSDKMKDERIIKQQKDFESDNTQKYDLAVADSLSNVGLDSVQTWVLSKKHVQGKYEGIAAAAAAIL